MTVGDDTLHGGTMLVLAFRPLTTGRIDRPGRLVCVDRSPGTVSTERDHGRFVVAHHFTGEDSWWQGHYFGCLAEAMAFWNEEAAKRC